MTISTIDPPNPATSSGQDSASDDHSPSKASRGLLASAIHMLPTLAVIACLAAVGVYGHHYHWKLPQFAELTGSVPSADDDWCEEHGVPESQCVECNPDLFPPEPDYGWCTEHGIHNCTLHHPGAAQVKSAPEVTQDDMNRADRGLALQNRRRNNAACKLYQHRIQFASIEAVQQAGIDVELVERRPIEEWVSGNGEVVYDATRLANLSSRVSGTAWRIFKNSGDRVREGEVLALVDAMEVGRLKADLVKALVAESLAQKNVDLLSGLRDGLVPGKQVLETEAALAKAEAEVLSAEQALSNLGLSPDVSALRGISQHDVQDRLRFLGLPQDLVREIAPQTVTSNLIPIRSAMNGVIVQRDVVSGELVEPSRVLFQVADPSRMWLMLSIPIEDASVVSLGQRVRFLPNGAHREVSGTINWISTAVDRKTRMLKVRADLDNSDGRLRDETFGTGRVILREEQHAIVVPKSALQWEGCCQVVFVRDKHYFDRPDSPKLFHVRTVRTGAVNGDVVEIIAGLRPGEVVVTEGSDVLRAQLLRNSLGAGCCGD